MTHSLRAVLLAFASGAAILALASCNKPADTGSGAAPGAPAESTAPMTAESTPAMAPAAVDLLAEEQKIRDLDNQWLQALNNKDALSSANMYAEDGAVLPPNAPMASGHDAILSTWTTLLATPGLTLSFAPTKVIVGASGDLAVDIGTYTSSTSTADPAATPTTETGKYMVTWVKRNGEWKVLADMFSSDAAAAPLTAPGVMPMAPGGTMPMAPGGMMAPGGTMPMAPGGMMAPGAPTEPAEQPAPGEPSGSMAPAPAPDATTPPAAPAQ